MNFAKVFLASLLVLSCGCGKRPETKTPIPPGYQSVGICIPDGLDAKGVPSIVTCKDEKGDIVGVYKKQ